jgi:hypothetical protein
MTLTWKMMSLNKESRRNAKLMSVRVKKQPSSPTTLSQAGRMGARVVSLGLYTKKALQYKAFECFLGNKNKPMNRFELSTCRLRIGCTTPVLHRR